MNLIDQQIQKIRKQKRLGLMTHVVLGYPDIKETEKIILAMVKQGVDFIELQIPFSDPLGDGSVIRKANTTALENRFKVEQAFELVKRLRQDHKVEIPLLFMTYFNIVFNYKVEEFCKQAAEVGINGLIVPDFTKKAEKHDKLDECCTNNNLYLIKFLSLDSSNECIKQLDNSGFVYCFAQRGITGERKQILAELSQNLVRFKKSISMSLAVGFGLSKPRHIEELKGKADIVIVGSSLLNAYNKDGIGGMTNHLGNLVEVL